MPLFQRNLREWQPREWQRRQRPRGAGPPTSPTIVVVFGVVLILFAGCVSPKAPVVPDAEDAPPIGFRYACPPGDTHTLSNGLCVSTFADPRETFEEPYLAVHPQRPEVMVLGMNAWHADPRPVVRDGSPSLEAGRVALFVTQDGGSTWQRVLSPPVLYGTDAVGTTSYSGDPVLEFDGRGVLHYLQASVAFDEIGGAGFPYIDIQYARSEDLGASWSQNLLLADDGDNDRPWLTVGPDGDLFVTWRNNMGAHRPPELARSTDGGTTWNVYAAPPGCTHGDQAIVHGDGILMPCTLDEEGRANTLQINRFKLETEQFEPLGTVPTPDGWDPEWALAQWDHSPDGVLALATRQKDPGGFVVFSHDGGLSWTEPIPLIALCGCDPETEALYTYGARFDPWGNFHLMLADAVVETPDNWDEGNTRYATGQRAVFHVVVDVEGRTLHQQGLTTGALEDARAPPGAALPIGRDDYHIPAFWDDGGAIVWTRDKGIDLTHVLLQAEARGLSGAPQGA